MIIPPNPFESPLFQAGFFSIMDRWSAYLCSPRKRRSPVRVRPAQVQAARPDMSAQVKKLQRRLDEQAQQLYAINQVYRVMRPALELYAPHHTLATKEGCRTYYLKALNECRQQQGWPALSKDQCDRL